MSTELDRESLAVLELARDAERALPRDPERVRQRVLAAVGAMAAVGASADAAASSLSPSAPVAATKAAGGVFGGSKLVGLASVALLAGAGAYAYSGADERAEVVTSPPSMLGAKSTPSARTVERGAPNTALAPLAEVSPQPAQRGLAAVELPERASAGRPSAPVIVGSRQPADALPSAGSRERRAASPSTPSAPLIEADSEPEERAAPPETTARKSAGLREDLRSLALAQQALSSGQAERALELTRSMRGGQLSAERTALEVFALCQLGRHSEATQKAEQFRRMAPDSPLLPRVNASCAKP